GPRGAGRRGGGAAGRPGRGGVPPGGGPMRLHLLRLTAFGSFPGTEEVDFDALSEAGLFLIHGPTGAGKTTVLDAVCFALYGRVPGQRDKARSLRCDHAPPGRGPVVELEVTIRDRRFRITRSPAWLRPKQRGTGLVEEKAKTRVEELTPAGWTARTTRSDEAGHLIGELLGMNADQFCQVAMLPQGEFARFLRADGEERRRLLERLFSVRIYTEVERWLAERRTETGREQQEAWREVESVIDRTGGGCSCASTRCGSTRWWSGGARKGGPRPGARSRRGGARSRRSSTGCAGRPVPSSSPPPPRPPTRRGTRSAGRPRCSPRRPRR